MVIEMERALFLMIFILRILLLMYFRKKCSDAHYILFIGQYQDYGLAFYLDTAGQTLCVFLMNHCKESQCKTENVKILF